MWAKKKKQKTTRHKSEGLLVIEVSFTAQHPQLSETRYCNFPSLPTRWEKTVQDVVSVAFSNSFATFRLNKTKKQSTKSTKICLGCLSVHRPVSHNSVSHVQHAYFPSLDQSNSLFMASSSLFQSLMLNCVPYYTHHAYNWLILILDKSGGMHLTDKRSLEIRRQTSIWSLTLFKSPSDGASNSINFLSQPIPE